VDNEQDGDERVDWLVRRALAQLEQGAPQAAVESLRQALSADPEDAHAHAVLAIALVNAKRLHGAEHEAREALRLNPDAVFAQHAAGVVYLALRKMAKAEEHLDRAISLAPDAAESRRTLARLYGLTGREDKMLPMLEAARTADPSDVDVWTDVGSYRLRRGDLAGAEEMARAVLAESAEHQDALVLMGEIMLRRGNVEAAAEHARAALAHNANDEGALRLLCEIKSRRSPLLGLWWRWSVFTGGLGDRRAFLLLMGMYLAYRIGVLALKDAGFPAASSALDTVWLAFAAYTWIAPSIFKRMLRAELATVRLRRDF
jgi:Tfp pilus assembly protein PilF